MIKQTITFPDLDGKSVTEDFYFHLSKSELAELAVSVEGGLKSYLESIIASNDGGLIIAAFKDIIAKSVGRRSSDNRRFEKSPEITNAFMQSAAYDEFFFSLIQDANAAANFVSGLVPDDVARSITATEPDKKEYTEADLLAMDDAQFNAVAGPSPKDWSREHLLVGMKRKALQP